MSRFLGLVKQTNPKIVEVLRRDSEVLARIQDSFHTVIKARGTENLPKIEISCFYEELPLLGVGLVCYKNKSSLRGRSTNASDTGRAARFGHITWVHSHWNTQQS